MISFISENAAVFPAALLAFFAHLLIH